METAMRQRDGMIDTRLKRPQNVRIRRGLLAALLGGSVIGATPLPAVETPATPEHHVGKVILVELVTPDLGAAERFYTGLFGWRFQPIEAGGKHYAEAYLDDRPVAALVEKPVPPGEKRQPAWISFLSVRDVDAAQKTALAKGAKLLYAPHDVPNRGRQAVLADPQGAVFAMLASSSGDPPDLLAEPGEWIWSALITRDPDTDAAFYQTIFDYEVFDLPADQGAQHLMLASDNYARASANALPANQKSTHPHWLNFVRVDDTVAMTAKLVALGGKVLSQPRVDRHGGKVAVVADPSGAPFGLLEWPETETKEVAQ
jgi:predicted enzyme related to lactoylglutathione lyase